MRIQIFVLTFIYKQTDLDFILYISSHLKSFYIFYLLYIFFKAGISQQNQLTLQLPLRAQTPSVHMKQNRRKLFKIQILRYHTEII